MKLIKVGTGHKLNMKEAPAMVMETAFQDQIVLIQIIKMKVIHQTDQMEAMDINRMVQILEMALEIMVTLLKHQMVMMMDIHQVLHLVMVEMKMVMVIHIPDQTEMAKQMEMEEGMAMVMETVTAMEMEEITVQMAAIMVAGMVVQMVIQRIDLLIMVTAMVMVIHQTATMVIHKVRNKMEMMVVAVTMEVLTAIQVVGHHREAQAIKTRQIILT